MLMLSALAVGIVLGYVYTATEVIQALMASFVFLGAVEVVVNLLRRWLLLGERRLALACSSHEGAAVHTQAVRDWLAGIGCGDDDLLCGRETPRDRDLRHALIRAGERPCQAHNQCSGKHTGFLTFHRHLGAEGAYVDPDGPVQMLGGHNCKQQRIVWSKARTKRASHIGIAYCQPRLSNA